MLDIDTAVLAGNGRRAVVMLHFNTTASLQYTHSIITATCTTALVQLG